MGASGVSGGGTQELHFVAVLSVHRPPVVSSLLTRTRYVRVRLSACLPLSPSSFVSLHQDVQAIPLTVPATPPMVESSSQERLIDDRHTDYVVYNTKPSRRLVGEIRLPHLDAAYVRHPRPTCRVNNIQIARIKRRRRTLLVAKWVPVTSAPTTDFTQPISHQPASPTHYHEDHR